MGKVASEFGGEGAQKNTILKNKPRRALSAEERRRLLMLTGTDNPLSEPDPAHFRGQNPRREL